MEPLTPRQRFWMDVWTFGGPVLAFPVQVWYVQRDPVSGKLGEIIFVVALTVLVLMFAFAGRTKGPFDPARTSKVLTYVAAQVLLAIVILPFNLLTHAKNPYSSPVFFLIVAALSPAFVMAWPFRKKAVVAE